MNTVAYTVAASSIFGKLFFYSALKREIAAEKKWGRGKKEVTAADFATLFKQVRREASDEGCMHVHTRSPMFCVFI